ncbi:hypothetical protein PQ478_09065 [Alkalihalophilus pseudofirmus]|uniref:hypothetical protein n=1 Tax=Alkalihalophilus pseudofirmus TaxID=79885 RepID=UPI00259B7B61|nr:hypothetical protein [Alkalihalophilus pseudofirmus]WEG18621.1 hypothetical protein PQ478_09065 [Alkalihalophilus pseudofirmus]
MSKQVEVTKEMADVLDEVIHKNNSIEENLYEVLSYINDYMPDLDGYLNKNNMSAHRLLDAITCGYKHKYEFKERDIVICEDTGTIYQLPTKLVSVSAANKLERFKLVCKAENREDK